MATDNPLLQQVVDIIVETAKPERVILFGSQARGDAGPDSDVDLLVIKREPFSASHRRHDEVTRLYLALRKIALTTDILVYSHDEFEHWKNSLNHVLGRAVPTVKEGCCMADIAHAHALLRLVKVDIDALDATAGIPRVAIRSSDFTLSRRSKSCSRRGLRRATSFIRKHIRSPLADPAEDNGEEIADLLPLTRYTVFAVEARYEESLFLDEPLHREDVLRDVHSLM